MKRILVALDASAVARHVLDQAASMARALGARLVLFRAVTVPPELPAELFLAPDGVEGELVKRAHADLEKLTAGLSPELVAGMQAKVGAPWQAICDAAAREGADLIVVGSHGYRGLDRLLGTTAARVVNHADRSVLVVRPPRL
jgi:nucleotide-binding universal stress UspA family protein